jgi:hypothetical protein
MRAFSIRQPLAELILRGIKTVQYRWRPTQPKKQSMRLSEARMQMHQ